MSIGAAVGIGVAGALLVSEWLWVFIAAGSFIVVAYNLELFGGRFHSDWWFAIAWGGFLILTGYFAMATIIRPVALLAAAFGCGYSLTQRRLSRHVRTVRRDTRHVTGRIDDHHGHSHAITPTTLINHAETALRSLCATIILLALTLAALHLQ